jgi:hypothetical protein
VFAEQAAPFGGFIGAIAFAALVLILQSPDKFENAGAGFGASYVSLLLLMLSLVVFFSMFGSLAWVFVSGGAKSVRLRAYASMMSGASVGTMIFAVPMLIAPFNLVLAIVITVIGIMMFIAEVWASRGP